MLRSPTILIYLLDSIAIHQSPSRLECNKRPKLLPRLKSKNIGHHGSTADFDFDVGMYAYDNQNLPFH